MRNWKVVVGLTLCCALSSTAWADTKVTAAEPKELSNPWGNQYAQLEMLRSMTAAQRTSSTNPFLGTTQEDGGSQKDRAVLQGEGDIQGETSGGSRVGILNNTCSTAVTVLCPSTTEVSFQTPYTEDNERRPSCAGNYAYYNSVWVKFVATAVAVKADLCTPSNAAIDDSLITIYRATNQASPCSSLVELACKDDSPNCGDDDASPEVVYGPLTVGETYYIQVGVLGYSGSCSPCTNGDYFLRIDCNDAYLPCQINTAGYQAENELEGCSEALRLNDGCNQDPVAFAAIACGEARTGNVSFDGSTRDTDWYRLVLNDPAQTYPVNINMSVLAEFVPDLFIIKKGATGDGCDDLQIVAANNPAGYVICQTTANLSYQANGPGEYWLFVGPNFCFGTVDCSRDYVLTVTTSACYPALGACCTGTSCVVVAREDCNPATSVYFGDGTTCQTGTCYVCPTPNVPEGESYTCPGHGFTDSLNGGCGFSSTSPPFLPASLTTLTPNVPTTPYCGITGTHFNAAPPNASQNLRDNDWYRWSLGGSPAAGQWRRIVVNIQAEFKAQVLIVNPDLGSSPCTTFASRIVLDTVVEPGPAKTVKACVVKRTGLNFFGDVWVIVRPYKRGTPYEIPCGVRYWFTVKQENCDLPGACCVTSSAGVSQGCQQLTAQACATAGGVYYGEGTPCAAICCPCPNGAVPENEGNCADPNDNTNGGCNSAGFGYPFNTTGLDQSGDSVCGTSRFDGSRRDTDWYVYNHTGGDIVLTLTPSDFIPLSFILKPGPGGDIATQCAGLSVVGGAQAGTKCTPLVATAAAQPAGTYWLWCGGTFDEAFTCRSYYAQVQSIGGGGATGGRCCVPPGDPNNPYSGCVILSQAACLAAGGTYGGDNTTCDPNPCPDCPLDCVGAEPEGEPNCGQPSDNTNGGCNSDPIIFSQVLNNSGDEVCGTVQFNGSIRDTDWYEYNHTGGDLIWFVAAEFSGFAFLVGPIYNPNDKCCGSYDAYAFDFPADCGYYGAYVSNLPAGQYQLIVVPSFDGGLLACGSKYRLQAASGVQGACCFEGQCFITYEDICVPGGGTWQGDGTDCDPNPCAQPTGACCAPDGSCTETTQASCSGNWLGAGTDCSPNPCPQPFCLGDADCDGDVDFFDIDPFVAKLGCPASDPGGCSAGCPWQNCDVDQDGDVDFFDIDPFVGQLGSVCP